MRVILTDENGNRLTHEKREIHVNVTGAGTFLAVGSGNPCTEDQITAKECHLYRGTAIVILKSKEAGETTITVNADGVEAGTCVVNLEGEDMSDKKILGYINEDSIVTEEQVKILTHIHVAFGRLTMEGTISFKNHPFLKQLPQIRKWIQR